MHNTLKQSYNIFYSVIQIQYSNTVLLNIIFLMTLRKYLDSYLYLEYFQKSNLVLGMF